MAAACRANGSDQSVSLSAHAGDAVQPGAMLFAQPQPRCGDVLAQVSAPGRSRNEQDVRATIEQPGECNVLQRLPDLAGYTG